MDFELLPFEDEYMNTAAGLVSARYQRLRHQVPLLPARYADRENLMRLLERIVAAGDGIVARHEGKVQGFLTAWRLPSFRGRPAVFAPEWGHAVAQRDGGRCYEAMYAHLAQFWQSAGYHTHLISLFPGERESITCWRWLGFGMIAVDALRDLQPVTAANGGEPPIRLATINDVDLVARLHQALQHHSAESPTFLHQSTVSDNYQEWLRDPGRAIWLAHRGDEPVAFLRIGPAYEDTCTIIRDDGTASITGAFTEAPARGTGIGTALLEQALAWARVQGYQRCAVDFEPMNPPARRFWLRYFQPVCYSYVRHI